MATVKRALAAAGVHDRRRPCDTPPNVVIVVLDCVREDTFFGGSRAAPGQLGLEDLRSESWVFPRAVSSAPWTVPSHASLFTGLPAWKHGLHYRCQTRLPPQLSTLGETLQSLGYATASFASNPLVGPITGLDRGFDEVRWGGWHEVYLRGVRGRPSVSTDFGSDSLPARVAGSLLFAPIANALQRRPGAVNALVRLMSTRFSAENGARVAGWVEPEFHAWLERIPTERPVFGFVNLLDAHEPYIGMGRHAPGVRDVPGGRVLPRQDRRDWLTGSWRPRSEEWDSIRGVYRETFPTLRERILEIVEILRSSGRWPNTIFVVTSDHGQAFGEQGMLFHGLKNIESLVRIPLWVRAPAHLGPSPPLDGWTSIASVRSIIESLVARSLFDPPSKLCEQIATEPTLPMAVADGIGEPIRLRMSRSRLDELDRPALTGYLGSTKVTLDVGSGRCVSVDVDEDPDEVNPHVVSGSGTDANLLQLLRAAAAEAFNPAGQRDLDVDDRLASWGYT